MSRRVGDIALGIFLIIISVLWVLLFGGVALYSALGTYSYFGWVVVSGALVLGILVFVLGVNSVRGRTLSGRGWLGWSVLIFLAPLPLPLYQVFKDDHGASHVNSAVERAYLKRSHVRRANADCAYDEQQLDDSEFWECEVENGGRSDPATPYDICWVYVMRSQAGNLKVRIRNCFDDDE